MNTTPIFLQDAAGRSICRSDRVACGHVENLIMCGEPKSAHTPEAARGDVAMDHDFIPATFDAKTSEQEDRETPRFYADPTIKEDLAQQVVAVMRAHSVSLNPEQMREVLDRARGVVDEIAERQSRPIFEKIAHGLRINPPGCQ